MAFIVVVLLMGNGIGEEKKPNDKEKLQGTWLVVETEFEGKTHRGNGLKLVFQGDKVSIRAKRPGETIEEMKGTFRLVPGKKPKALDLTLNQKGKALGEVLGIYELDGETLRLCLDKVGAKRPTEFKTKAKTQITVLVLQREQD
jgi:uncharacterized protein (TIGR03067 family)